jgi:hypothetical protein
MRAVAALASSGRWARWWQQRAVPSGNGTCRHASASRSSGCALLRVSSRLACADRFADDVVTCYPTPRCCRHPDLGVRCCCGGGARADIICYVMYASAAPRIRYATASPPAQDHIILLTLLGTRPSLSEPALTTRISTLSRTTLKGKGFMTNKRSRNSASCQHPLCMTQEPYATRRDRHL